MAKFRCAKGGNEFLFKFASDGTTPPFECHVLFSDHRNLEAVIVDLPWTQFPWDMTDSAAST